MIDRPQMSPFEVPQPEEPPFAIHHRYMSAERRHGERTRELAAGLPEQAVSSPVFASGSATVPSPQFTTKTCKPVSAMGPGWSNSRTAWSKRPFAAPISVTQLATAFATQTWDASAATAAGLSKPTVLHTGTPAVSQPATQTWVPFDTIAAGRMRGVSVIAWTETPVEALGSVTELPLIFATQMWARSAQR